MIAEVALALPVRGTFHYRVPEGWGDLARRGSVVLAPFSRRMATGYVVATGGAPPAGVGELKPLRQLLEPGEAVPPDLMALAEQVADYYLAPLGEVLRAALPGSRARTRLRPALTEAGHAALHGDATLLAPIDRSVLASLEGTRRGASIPESQLRRLTRAGLVALEAVAESTRKPRFERRLALGVATAGERAEAARRSAPAARLLGLLEGAGEPVALTRVRAEARPGPAVIRRLEAQGLVRVEQVEVARDAPRAAATDRFAGLALTPAQEEAAAAVKEAMARGGFAPFLLHGITGSGKTLVYLDCLAAALERGRSALLLVPEIALTPRLARELRGRFGERVATLHSGLGPGERYDAWRRVRSGEARIAFGARSAVFAPAVDLGLIVVDEEHDPSYKQDGAPHHNARDVAVLRAQKLGIPVVLGSATPALESYHNALSGRYRHLELQLRPAGQVLPEVELVDLRQEFEREGQRLVLSERLLAELGRTIDRGEQAVVLLNRRGYANFLLCRECGQRAECPDCSVCLAFHFQERRLKCHRCGYGRGAPDRCPSCKGTFLNLVGQGTEKVEKAVQEALPRARVERLDRDSARGRDAVEERLARFERGEIDVLVGTQMVAKGHDYPNVTLVGVISIDSMLALPDFRATERAFALLTQVAGRAGRGDRPGRVLLQTFHPDNEAVKLACLQDYPRFFAREARLRRLMRYPPWTHLVNLVVRGRERDVVQRHAREAAVVLRAATESGVSLLGPAMAPIERLKKDFRAQLLLRGATRAALRRTLERARPGLEPLLERNVIDVDVDPQDLL